MKAKQFLEEAKAQGKPTYLSVFCGLGGDSDGFALEGFAVLGVDVEDMPSKGYKHRFIQADIRDLRGEDFRGFDVIWGSPPCRDFTILSDKQGTKTAWKIPKNPERGLQLVKAYLKFVEDAQPKFWLMENVFGLAKYLPELKPLAYKVKLLGGKKHILYGNAPIGLIPNQALIPLKFIGKPFDPMRKWLRAKIPLACSRALARACREALP